MKRQALADRLLATFIGELEEQVGNMTQDVLLLESDPSDPEALKRLFRSAHTLKGAAHAAGVPLVQHACHHVETLLAAVRDGRAVLGADQVTLLLQTIDALGDAHTRLRQRTSLDDAPIAAIVEQISTDEGYRAPPARSAPAQTAPTRVSSAPPPVTSAPPGAPTATVTATAETGTRAQVRVAADKLDDLLASVGEVLTLSRRLLARFAADGAEDARLLSQAAEQLGTRTRALRMRPFADACDGLARAVRDIASNTGREARFELHGADIEVDRAVLDTLRPALLHLVRNAVAHGIEPPEQREQQGKPRVGVVRVEAQVQGDGLIVTVADDGAGIDVAALRAQHGAGATTLEDETTLARTIFEAGMSTQPQVTDVAGRGVGLDAALAAVESLRGSIEVDSRAGAGTTFTLETPLTLAALHVVVVEAGGERLALPARGLERLMRLRTDEIERVDGRPMIATATGPVPLATLSTLLGYEDRSEPHNGTLAAALVTTGERRIALIVDRFLAAEEVLVRPLQRVQPPPPHIIGAAIRADGDAVLVLDYDALIVAAADRPDTGVPAAAARASAAPYVLVADDSITTRTLLQGALESAGYRVHTAADGAEAFGLLKQQHFDLLVSDVEMPGMDGFTLCEAVRAAPALERMPVILVTGLESADQRARGLTAGADAYLTKSSFDQDELLRRMRQLLG